MFFAVHSIPHRHECYSTSQLLSYSIVSIDFVFTSPKRAIGHLRPSLELPKSSFGLCRGLLVCYDHSRTTLVAFAKEKRYSCENLKHIRIRLWDSFELPTGGRYMYHQLVINVSFQLTPFCRQLDIYLARGGVFNCGRFYSLLRSLTKSRSFTYQKQSQKLNKTTLNELNATIYKTHLIHHFFILKLLTLCYIYSIPAFDTLYFSCKVRYS